MWSGVQLLHLQPMRRIRRSFGHAWTGITHALRLERNLQLFVPVYGLLLIVGVFLRLLAWEWLALLIAGAGFFAMELMNTALERLTDVFDDSHKMGGRTHHHSTMKATKDTAAAASLVSFLTLIVVIIIVFLPYLKLYFF